jgi:cation:H+ antiporter
MEKTILLVIAQSGAGLALLYFGGDFLVRGASSLAARVGVSHLAIGLTVVAFGTSMPELVVSIDAALSGANDISIGNVVGSNIANIALILGLVAILRPATVHAKIVRIDAPIMVLVSLLLLAVLIDGRASRAEGAALLAGLVAYLIFTFWEASRESDPVRREFETAAPASHSRTSTSLVLVVVGVALLVAGGHLLVTAAIALAEMLPVSQAVIGLTIVAIGTSLPEVATSAVAAARGQGDIAIGNVVGSNIFNILGILGMTAIIRPLEMGDISWVDLGVMVALAAVLATLLFARRRLGRVEGFLLLASYAVYTRSLFVS